MDLIESISDKTEFKNILFKMKMNLKQKNFSCQNKIRNVLKLHEKFSFKTLHRS